MREECDAIIEQCHRLVNDVTESREWFYRPIKYVIVPYLGA